VIQRTATPDRTEKKRSTEDITAILWEAIEAKPVVRPTYGPTYSRKEPETSSRNTSLEVQHSPYNHDFIHVTLLSTDLELDRVFASSELARLVVSYFSRYLVPLERLSKTEKKIKNIYGGNGERLG